MFSWLQIEICLKRPYYEGTLRASAMTNPMLLRILRRKVGYRGEEPCRPGKLVFFYYLYYITTKTTDNLAGTKSAIIEALKRHDMDFVTVINKTLPPANQYFVELKMGTAVLASEAEKNYVLSKIESLPVTRGILRQLQLGSHVGTVMDCTMKLFQCRSSRICECHREVNEAHDNYEPYRNSIFLPSAAFQDLRAQQFTPQQIIATYFRTSSTCSGESLNMSNFKKIYFVSKAIDSFDIWVLYVVDLELHSINYLDPRRNSNSIVSEDLTIHLNETRDMLSVLLRVLLSDNEGTWVCNVLSPYYFSPLINNYDSGLYIIAAIYFLCAEVPLFFDHGTISRLRLNLAYWLLVGELPI